MSGIVGIYFLDEKPVERFYLEAMLNEHSILRRGLDTKGIWCEGPVGLGQCALWTTPEQKLEQQPLIDKTSGLVLVMDGRVDNRKELTTELLSLGINASLITDADIVLNAYKAWGVECPKKIIGDFAFVIWDKHCNQLFCARDALGVRPFYYYRGKNFFAFASDPGAIFTLPEVVRRLNTKVLLDYLVNNFNDYKLTEFERLFRLLSAHTLTIKNNSLQFHQYWDIEPNKLLKLKRYEEYKEAFLSVFEKSIVDRLRTIGGTGVLLSGGIDSSSILCMIEDLKTHGKVTTDISAYSAIFPGEFFNEEDYILSIQRKWKTKIDLIKPRLQIPVWEISEGIRGSALPLTAPQFYIFQDLVKRAFSCGNKVLLTGHGGDEFMDSPLNLAVELLLNGHLFQANKYVNEFSKFKQIPYTYMLKYLFKNIFSRFIPKEIKNIRKHLSIYKKYPWISRPYIKQVIKSLGSNPWYFHKHKFQNQTREVSYSSVHAGYWKRVLEECSRLAFSAGTVELRMPFYDRRLVELVLSIPDEKLIFNGKPKGFLRNALGSRLPEQIVNRKAKLGYTFTMNKELIANYPDKVKMLLISSELETLGLINESIARAEYDNYCYKNRNKLNKKEGATDLWQVIALEAWLRNLNKPNNQQTKEQLVYNEK